MMNENGLKIAVISGPENGSPRVLAVTLSHFIRSLNYYSRVFFKAKAIKRLLKSSEVDRNFIVWFFYKIIHFWSDQIFFNKLRSFDAVIICDWTPNGFYRSTYNIIKFKKNIRFKPVLYYAVQYLENSPTQIKRLKAGGHPLMERYDWHLSVSEVTEIRQKPVPPWSRIGLYLKSTGLEPTPKTEFLAVIDFIREGYEQYREEQIRVLEELDIPYISLEGKYDIEEIRNIYRKASLYFIQFPEAFGMPIAECLACGSFVCTPDSSWPMAWRLNEDPEIHGPGKLPECFIVYKDKTELKSQLITLRKRYDLEKTPREVFKTFYRHYPFLYEGDPLALKDVLTRLQNQSLNS